MIACTVVSTVCLSAFHDQTVDIICRVTFLRVTFESYPKRWLFASLYKYLHNGIFCEQEAPGVWLTNGSMTQNYKARIQSRLLWAWACLYALSTRQHPIAEIRPLSEVRNTPPRSFLHTMSLEQIKPLSNWTSLPLPFSWRLFITLQ